MAEIGLTVDLNHGAHLVGEVLSRGDGERGNGVYISDHGQCEEIALGVRQAAGLPPGTSRE